MNILLLEDMPDQQAAIGGALRERGHTVQLASTLYEARVAISPYVLDAAAHGLPPWDAVFADHDMPYDNPDGPDDGSTAAAIKMLLQAKPEIVVVAISAVPSNNDHLLSVGASIACEKGELLACLDEVLHRIETIRLTPSA